MDIGIEDFHCVEFSVSNPNNNDRDTHFGGSDELVNGFILIGNNSIGKDKKNGISLGSRSNRILIKSHSTTNSRREVGRPPKGDIIEDLVVGLEDSFNMMNFGVIFVSVDGKTMGDRARIAHFGSKTKDRDEAIGVVGEEDVSNSFDGFSVFVGFVRVAIVKRMREVLFPIGSCEIDGSHKIHLKTSSKVINKGRSLINFTLLNNNHSRIGITALLLLNRRVNKRNRVLRFRIILHLSKRHCERSNKILLPRTIPIKHIKREGSLHIAVIQFLNRNLKRLPLRIQSLLDEL